MIYADNAATTQMGEAAINAMTACMRDTWGNPSSLYGLGQRAKEALEDAWGLPQGNHLHLRGQRGGQPGHPFRRPTGGPEGETAYHLHRL